METEKTILKLRWLWSEIDYEDRKVAIFWCSIYCWFSVRWKERKEEAMLITSTKDVSEDREAATGTAEDTFCTGEAWQQLSGQRWGWGTRVEHRAPSSGLPVRSWVPDPSRKTCFCGCVCPLIMDHWGWYAPVVLGFQLTTFRWGSCTMFFNHLGLLEVIYNMFPGFSGNSQVFGLGNWCTHCWI